MQISFLISLGCCLLQKNEKQQQQQQQQNASSQLHLNCFVVLLVTENLQLCDGADPHSGFFSSLLFLPAKNWQKHENAIIRGPSSFSHYEAVKAQCSSWEKKCRQ